MYSWDPEEYARNSRAQKQWADQLIEKLDLMGFERVLDLGCGDGKITAEIAGKVKNGAVVGVDLSPDMIRYASSRFPSSTCPNLAFIRADARHLPFKESFDIIFSNAALHWIRDHELVLRGMHHCLRPGGKVLIQMGGTGNAASVMEVFLEITGERYWKQYFNGFSVPYAFFSPEEYRRLLAGTGFQAVRVVLIRMDMTQDKREGFSGWIRTTWHPFLDAVPPSIRDELLSEVIDRYIYYHPPDRDGRIHVDMVRLEVEAIRNA